MDDLDGAVDDFDGETGGLDGVLDRASGTEDSFGGSFDGLVEETAGFGGGATRTGFSVDTLGFGSGIGAGAGAGIVEETVESGVTAKGPCHRWVCC